MEKEYISASDFYHLSVFILDFLGKDHRYEDGIICIERQIKDLIITRKKIPESTEDSLRLTINPVSMFNGYINIRHHGEHIYIVPHMRRLASNREYADQIKVEYLLTNV